MLLNTAEMESLMTWLEATYPAACRRVRLPNLTHQGATVHALRLGKPGAPGAMIIGGVHAREWGGPDICLQLATDLLAAHRAGKGLEYGATRFSAGEIRRLLETAETVVFPCVNPDGYAFSRSPGGAMWWRKNRNPAYHDGTNAASIGADINRNYDFLWDFRRHFHPAEAGRPDTSLASDRAASDFFHGAAPFSENETRNVKWLLDESPNVTRFLDLHSYAGTMLHVWGDDENQTTDPAQRFTNPAFDGKRGLEDAAYREYIDAADQDELRDVAQQVAQAMKGVRGRAYTPAQSVALLGWYPTSGASDDYAYSRHVVNPALRRTLGFTMEFNFDGEGFFRTAEPAVLEQTKLEVVPGLIRFCLTAVPPPRPEAPGTLIRLRFGVDGGGVFAEVSGIVIVLPNGRRVAIPPIRVYIFGPGGPRPQDPHHQEVTRVFGALAALVEDESARQVLAEVGAQVVEAARGQERPR